MTAGTGSDIGSSGWDSGHRVNQASGHLARQRASGHQASSHLARQRAPRHLARQWAPSQTGMTAGQTGAELNRLGWTAGIGSPGIRSFGLPAGTASSGKAVGTGSPGIGQGHRVIRLLVWLDSGHRVTRHQVIWARQRAPRHLARHVGHRVTRYDSGHQVIRYRIVWLDSGH
ncbi:unnamed protein product, partial [Staurois parvus]